MTSKKIYYFMLAVVGVLFITAVAIFILGNSSLKQSSKKLIDLKLQNKLLEEQQTALIRAKKDIAQYADLEKVAKTVVPQDKDQARAVREIISIAQQSNIGISGISFPSSSLGSKTASGGSASSTSSAAKSPLSQAKPVDGIPGIYSLEMTITPDTTNGPPISYYQFLGFLRRLENNRRTAQVSQIKIDPLSTDRRNPYISFVLTINIFVKP